MADKFSYDVFLSHNSKDKPRVRKLAERLKQAGLRVWFDEWNIKPGEIISLKVDEGLDQSRVLLLCISPNALASGWVALERSTAIHRDPSNESRRFIPLLLVDCELPDTLYRYKYVDFRKETKTAFAELVTACRPEAPESEPLATAPSNDTIFKPHSAKPQCVPEGLCTLELTLNAHSTWITSITFSPDGTLMLTGAEDSQLKIWDFATGQCRATLTGHGRAVTCGTFTSDGKQVVSGSWDATFRLWNVESQRLVWTAPLDRFVESVMPMSDSSKVASASRDGVLRFWDLKAKKEIFQIHTQTDTYKDDWIHACLSKNEQWIVCSHGDWKIRIWDVPTRQLVGVLDGHPNAVNSIGLTRDERYILSGSCDHTVKLWDLNNYSCVGSFEGHKHYVDQIAVSPTDSIVASAARDGCSRIWNWQQGALLGVIRFGQNLPTSVAFSRDGSRLVIGTSRGTIYIFKLALPAAPATAADRRYVNAKVVLIGEGTVGKTSLAHRLIEDKYVVRDRTHGMNVWQLDLPLPPDAKLEREALLWDLAGQEDYRLIHQLFLDETALALLLVNPQKDDPFAEAGDWLKALKAACSHSETSRDVNRLLIFSQIDVGGMKLGNAKIERLNEQYGFNDWLETSAKSGENCSDSQNGNQPSRLKQLIASSIPWDKLPWTSTPRLLTELKKAVVAMRDKTDIRLLRFAELTQRLEQALPGEKFGESDVRTAVTLLANHGLARALKFGDLVLLQPELLNGYAGAIVRAARANKHEIGSVQEAEIYEHDFDFTGVERLKQRADEDLLLRALVQTFLDHSLCIAEDTPQGRQLVFPSQFRREKDIPRDPDIFVSYTFSGEWQSVWTTLIVRLWYSQEFGHKELWRNAAEFASPKGFTLGLKIDNKQGEGTATVSLYFDKEVPDELKAFFIEYVHRHLAKYGCEVSRDRRYICSKCGKAVTDLAEVRKRLEAKKDFIYCQGCDKKVPLVDFIEQRLKSDPVAFKILAMDETATRELDTQALEQILIGHMLATCGEANQIFRTATMPDYGIDGEVEFKDDNGKPSGKRIYVQLKSENSYSRTRRSDGSEVFEIKNAQHIDYWTSLPVDVYLVIRQSAEAIGAPGIRWMNVTRYLKDRKDKTSPQIIFTGEKLDMEAVWKVRDQFFPPRAQRQK
ncbi:MAG TPA: TIR domain-containing protein [Pyrinomonadaceae bacterium]|nr:TIR domain-containing protein [Pyrinomonadaceae bacterium]